MFVIIEGSIAIDGTWLFRAKSFYWFRRRSISRGSYSHAELAAIGIVKEPIGNYLIIDDPIRSSVAAIYNVPTGTD